METRQLQPEHVMKVLRSLPRDLRSFLADKRVGPIGRTARSVSPTTFSPIFLAGGFIRAIIAGEEPSDIDLFSNETSIQQDAFELARIYGASPQSTDNAYTIAAAGRLPVQFITRWLFSEAQLLLASFDFTIAQAAIWYDPQRQVWRSLCADRFYADLASKSIVYLYPDRKEDAGGSMLRVVRFLRKGYSISPENLGAVVSRLLSVFDGDSTFYLASNEAERARRISLQFRVVDPLQISDGILETEVLRYERTADGLVERLDGPNENFSNEVTF